MRHILAAMLVSLALAGPVWAAQLPLKVDIGQTATARTDDGWISWDETTGGFGWDDSPRENHDGRFLQVGGQPLVEIEGRPIKISTGTIGGLGDTGQGGKAAAWHGSAGEDLAIDFLDNTRENHFLRFFNLPDGDYELSTFHNQPDLLMGIIPFIQVIDFPPGSGTITASQDAMDVPHTQTMSDDELVPGIVTFSVAGATESTGVQIFIDGGGQRVNLNGFILIGPGPVIPEPTTVTLLCLGGLPLLLLRRRRRRRSI